MTSLQTGMHYPIDLDSLPASWDKGYVGDFALVIQPGFASGKHNKEGLGIPHIRPYNIDRLGKLDLSEIKSVAPDADTKRLHSGDVLFNNTNSPELIGKTSVISAAGDWGFSNHMTRVAFSDAVSPKFAAYQLHYLWMRGYFLHNCVKHVNQASVSSTTLARAVPFVKPSRPQQDNIVAEIEKQFSRLDEAITNLKRVKANLKRYKAAALKAAVEGKLTEDWRLSARAASRKRAQASELETIPKAGKDKWFVYIIECDDGSYYVGHTADLHARWQAHCEGNGADWTRQHPPKYLVHFEECGSREDAVKREKDLKTGFGRTWRKRELDAGRMKPLVHNPANETALPVHDEDMQTGSKLLERILTERRAKWSGRGKYKEPTAPDTSDLPDLPDRWGWATMQQLGELNRGKSKHWPRNDPKLFGGPYPFIQTGDVKHSGGFVRSHTQTYNESGLAQSRLWPAGTLCITIAANIAETCILTYPACFPDSIVGFVFDSAPVTVRFIDLFFRTEREEIARFAPATAQKNINLEILSEVAVPFPPPEEQKEIVAEVERRLSVIEELEATTEANLTRAERLRQSILTRVFSGGLTKFQ